MGLIEETWRDLRKQLNFYRVHLLVFTFTPLVFSVILWACNGRYEISYVDCLFLCVSAMTVCGLATVDLSSLTRLQQVILFFQMCLGSPVLVSWVMVYLRRHYLAKTYAEQQRVRGLDAGAFPNLPKASESWPRRIASLFRNRRHEHLSEVTKVSLEEKGGHHDRNGSPIPKKLNTHMIRRVNDAPRLVNPSGWVSEGHAVPQIKSGTLQLPQDPNRNPSVPLIDSGSTQSFQDPNRNPAVPLIDSGSTQSPQDPNRILTFVEPSPERSQPRHLQLDRPITSAPATSTRGRRLSDPGVDSRPRRPSILSAPVQRYETIAPQTKSPTFPRTQTVEFNIPTIRRTRIDRHPTDVLSEQAEMGELNPDERRSLHRLSIPRPLSMTTHVTSHTYKSNRSKHRGFGGFPMPHEIVHGMFSRFFPSFKRKLTRSVTMPHSTTLASIRGDGLSAGDRSVNYITFSATVGRNSVFRDLSDEQARELGNVELRALGALLWIVAGYHLGIQLISYVVIAPYMTLRKWQDDFVPPALHRSVPSPWFSLFQVVSSYTNTGMSLVDTSLVPFQKAYPLIVFMMILILAGNTAFPIFLRFAIWILSKLFPRDSRANETLHFLLDHPRRCFIYLFPSHQTWFLLTIVVTLNATDWFFFMVLDIGNPAMESIPVGVRFIDGLLQAIAVRAAGFGIVPLSSLAPGVKILYVIMMYISVYPIAMSVRSTNVYEEQSLGVFREDEAAVQNEDEFEASGSRVTVWSRYLSMHARKQLAFDMWWLGLALFLVCIIERGNIDKSENSRWFNIFTIVFELVSAYGTVGLSLGIPTANYSLSGAFRPLSKLIVCIVMIRGRHRGLPVAIDRAVMIPTDKDPGLELRDNGSEYQPQSTGSRNPQYSGGRSAAADDRTSENGGYGLTQRTISKQMSSDEGGYPRQATGDDGGESA